MTATLDPTTETGDLIDPIPPQRRTVPPSLVPWQQPNPWIGRLSTLVLLIAAGLTRFWALGSPPGLNTQPNNGFNFDEVYYATEAQELLRFGYEDNRGFMFIVHPPLGKWIIAFGEWLVGAVDGQHSSSAYLSNSLGWRIMPALFGCIGVVIVARTARRMFRSDLYGFIAGVLMLTEGMSLVLARTAILDIFLQTFVLASFAAMVLDRDMVRGRLARMIELGIDLSDGAPTLGPRPWRVAAGVLMGCALAVKWTALSFFVVFVLLGLLWDRGALRAAGVRRPMVPWLRRSGLPAVGSAVMAPIATYLFCWLGWFAGENSWNRHWAGSNGSSATVLGFLPFDWGWLPGPIRSLFSYHYNAYTFHENLYQPHPYGSSPWSWLVLGRPVDFYYNGSEHTCGASACSREILLIGNPIMWWAFVPVLLWLVWHWATTRDWRAGAVLLAFAAGWLVWFQDLKRTMFLFYMAPLMPFLIFGMTLALGTIIGPSVRRAPDDERPLDTAASRRRTWGSAAVGAYLGLVVVDFAWMWPLYTGSLLTTAQWHDRMWLPSWV